MVQFKSIRFFPKTENLIEITVQFGVFFSVFFFFLTVFVRWFGFRSFFLLQFCLFYQSTKVSTTSSPSYAYRTNKWTRVYRRLIPSKLKPYLVKHKHLKHSRKEKDKRKKATEFNLSTLSRVIKCHASISRYIQGRYVN